jgi:hypothetical protein
LPCHGTMPLHRATHHPTLSSHLHHVLETPLSPLMMTMPSLGQGEAGIGQHRTHPGRPVMPARAHSRHGRARARARPIASVLPLTSASAHSITTTPATRQTCPLSLPCPVVVTLIDDFRRTSGRRRSLPSHSVHLFLHHQALDDRHDARNPTPSSRCPFVAQRAVAMDATVNPAAPLSCYK